MEPTRRQFLSGACALVSLGIGTVLLADSANAAPGVIVMPNGQVQVTVAQVPTLSKVNGVVNLGNVKGIPTAIVRTGKSTYKALNLKCPHFGITVLDESSDWLCPGHGSTFALNGTFISGPAQQSLAVVPSRLTKGVLTVG